ncbi:stretch-activated Ca2+-permeable channel component-domain-containing protein [Bombardia bombarda]|uniref:Stretch-activated Ca2+-permeable channel component-domain-containing protein n=1 Tax=Bombardia bombarda TaxID=252184 RepID=A0AA39XJW9_9PEZI|nr:stretch-activated Ca2+-permeable channel component-domain-containing protein [Bombardia bombarda]
MKLSPLQSRLAASFVASCLLVALYFALFSPNVALAAELKRPSPIILDDADLSLELSTGESVDSAYEPDFPAFDRSIIGRAIAEASSLTNNEATPMNVVAGTTQYFMFSISGSSSRETRQGSLELRDEHYAMGERDAGAGADADADLAERDSDGLGSDGSEKIEKRQASRKVYISANTCLQPQPKDPSKTAAAPPQLTLFLSTSSSNQNPGPGQDAKSQSSVAFTEGAVMYNVTTASSDVYIGVFAPNISSSFTGIYNFEIAPSTEGYFHTFNVDKDADLIWVDSDAQGALMITHNLTQSPDPTVQAQIMGTEPYVMFAQNDNDGSINGVRYSYCGLQNYAQIAAAKNGERFKVLSGMTKRGQPNLPKQQFFFSGLNASSNYTAILAQNGKNGNLSLSGNNVVGGGGHVFKATNFTTKSNHGNCAIVLNLDFCDQVAYSVPSNPNYGNSTVLAKFYDGYASSVYANFQKALAQVQCEAPTTQRYSLTRNCTNCEAAYKEWLCSVTIPRCEDFSVPADYLHSRAMSQPFPNGEVLDQDTLRQLNFQNTTAFNSSRNPLIDSVVKPGPYKEVLPCDDLCYNLVQSCPASLGFSCPRPGDVGYKDSYYPRPKATSGDITCNYQGSAHIVSGTTMVVVKPWVVLGGSVMGLMMVLVL